jgi:hypothetical protein
MRNPFGWSLPPGCTHRHIDEAFGIDRPCEICGGNPDANECICPECTVCGAYGDPYCYEKGHLTLNIAQYMQLKELEAAWKEEADAMAEAQYQDYKEVESIFDEE